MKEAAIQKYLFLIKAENKNFVFGSIVINNLPKLLTINTLLETCQE
jgi:capsular polysaccharide biosynthesis protein